MFVTKYRTQAPVKPEPRALWLYSRFDLARFRTVPDLGASLRGARLIGVREILFKGSTRFEAMFDHPTLGTVAFRRRTIAAVRRELEAMDFPNPPALSTLGPVAVRELPPGRERMN